MSEYRGKHAPSKPWPVASSASMPLRRGRHRKKNRRRVFRVVLILLVVLALAAWPFVEARIVTVEKVSVKSADLPSAANHFKVVYVTDIHWGHWFSDSQLQSLFLKIKSLQPDLVLFGGDYATDNASAVEFFGRVQNLSGQYRIHSRYGLYGVLGEADRGETDFDRDQVTEAMTNAGITPLVNESVPVYIGSGTIWLAGLDDYLAGRPDLKAVASKVNADDFVILLSHNPAVIQEAQQTLNASGSLGWFDIGLFGHTHGGQMKLFSPMADEIEDIPERYISGWLTENRSQLLFSNGVGTSGFPGRLLCPARIHLIELLTE